MSKPINNSALDQAELGLRLGLTSRRSFLTKALAAGATLPFASSIANASTASAANQKLRRARLLSRYDFIIIGGGAAGCVLADRLSEDGTADVLLIERGGAEFTEDRITTPIVWPTLLGSDVDYGATRFSTPQDGLNGRVLGMNGGRVLGGSGSTNGMIWQLGDERDFDQWEERAGRRWGADSMFRTYQRLKITPIKASVEQGLTRPYIDGHKQVLGLKEIDVNTERRIDGVSILDNNIVDGRRFSALNAYLFPALERRNLTVLINTGLEQLLFAHGACFGIECRRHKRRETVFAGEVILSAGAIESPAILLRSGIGPRGALRRAGVHQMVDSPNVGRNLKDHALMLSPVFQSPRALPPTAGQGASTVAYLNTRRETRSPGIQLLGAQFGLGPFDPPERFCSILPGLMKPRSRGFLEITGPRLNDPLVINPNYLTRDRDVEDILEGVNAARDVASSDALFDFFLSEVQPGPFVTRDDDLIEFIRNTIGTYFHYVSTCAMGTDDDSVLDPSLRVRGVKNLRVVDASAIPEITASNTHVPTLLVAEKAAQVIRRQTDRSLVARSEVEDVAAL